MERRYRSIEIERLPYPNENITMERNALRKNAREAPFIIPSIILTSVLLATENNQAKTLGIILFLCTTTPIFYRQIQEWRSGSLRQQTNGGRSIQQT